MKVATKMGTRTGGLFLPEGACVEKFVDLRSAFTHARSLAAVGYQVSQAAHTKVLKPGRAVVFRHRDYFWCVWLPVQGGQS